MIFKVLNAHQDSKLYVTGHYCVESPEENEKLVVMRECLSEVSSPDGTPFNQHMVLNERTILFKSVPIDVLASTLSWYDTALKLNLKIAMGKNMEGNLQRGKISDCFRQRGLKEVRPCD